MQQVQISKDKMEKSAHKRDSDKATLSRVIEEEISVADRRAPSFMGLE